MSKPYAQKEWLRGKYHAEELTTEEIAGQVGCSKETIRRWLHKHDIPLRDKGARKGVSYTQSEQLLDEDWLEQEYVEKQRPAFEIARDCGVSKQTVLNKLNEYGIETRDCGNVMGKNIGSKTTNLDDEKWLRNQYTQQGKSMHQIARENDVTSPAVMYWIDEHGIERRHDGPSEYTNPDSEFQRDPMWEEKRQQRLGIDNHECQDCGVLEEEYYRSLDVHHLKPKEEFLGENDNVDWDAANHSDNLVSLCQSCHLKRHHSGEI